jgi:alpha-glucosidase
LILLSSQPLNALTIVFEHIFGVNYFKLFITFLLLFFAIPCFAQNKIKVESPDGDIVFTFKLTKQAPVYKVSYKGHPLIKNSKLGLNFKKGDFKAGLCMGKPHFSKVDDTYHLVVGKTNTARNHYRQMRIPIIEQGGNKRKVILVVRAFNDGVAFRYKFPEQKNWHSYTLLDEQSTFNIVGNPTVKTLYFGNFINPHEGHYHTLPYSKINADTLMDMPALFEFSGHIYMAITEANLQDYAGMYLKKHHGLLKSQLTPLPGQTGVEVKAAVPGHTPWRVMMISDRMGKLLASNILTNLCPPNKIKDTSWIKPGKTTFHWWNGDITPDTTFAPGVNFSTAKYYIDFAAANNIPYSAVIGYGGFAWYKSDAPNYSVVGPHTDVTQPVTSLDLQKVIDYAKKKGVGIDVWVNWKAIYPHLEKAFSQFEKWGIKGMMVDFLNRSDQKMVQIQEKILKVAAKHHLLILFHGTYKPTGLSRTYPNEVGREGALNYEYDKWTNKGVGPDHDLDEAFTRLLAGPASYHLGGFRAVSPDEFKTQYTRPFVLSTRSHMLAMYVVMGCYMPMVADYPKAYKGQPGFNFIKEVPVNWDETVVPNAVVGKYVTIARRKGKSWYLGSLNNSSRRTIKVALNFLSDGKYKAEIYSDAPDNVEHPNHLVKQTKTVTKSDTLTVHLAAGGGQAVRLVEK